MSLLQMTVQRSRKEIDWITAGQRTSTAIQLIVSLTAHRGHQCCASREVQTDHLVWLIITASAKHGTCVCANRGDMEPRKPVEYKNFKTGIIETFAIKGGKLGCVL